MYRGESILLGIDPIAGLSAPFTFPYDLRSYLEDLNICTLAQVHNPCYVDQHYWYSASDLDLGGSYALWWNDFISDLSAAGIRFTDSSDKIVWTYNHKKDYITAKEAYDCILFSSSHLANTTAHIPVWHKALPQKISCFIWLAVHNRILTWGNLQ